jgi:hypothetical protein
MNERHIYTELVRHQQTTNWDGWCPPENRVKQQSLFAELHRWIEIFVFEFKLEIPTVSLAVDRLGRRRLGHFRACNGFGLSREIVLDSGLVSNGPTFELLGTLLHELLHAWQYVHSKPGKHNREYQRKAADFGLHVNRKGQQQYYPSPTPFTVLLQQHGVSFPEIPSPKLENLPRLDSSKLRLWECVCGQKARVARADFAAICVRCNTQFQMMK